MKNYIVRFNEHVEDKSIASMVTGLAAYGNVSGEGRKYQVKVKESKAPGLEEKLVAWDVHGFLRWEKTK